MKGLSKKQLLQENQELLEENARLRQDIELLRQKMDVLIRRVFGRSSEKLDASQLDLFLISQESESGKVDASSLEEADPRHEAKARRGARCRERWPADLPVVEEIIDPKEVQKAPQDWRLIGAEVSNSSTTNRDGSCAEDWCVANTCGVRTRKRLPLSLHCRRACKSAALRRPDFWRRSS